MAIYGVRTHPLDPVVEHVFPGDLALGDTVCVPTEDGETLGEVTGIRPDGPEEETAALPAILRVADADDLARAEENLKPAREAAAFCRACIVSRRMEMKLTDVAVHLDRGKYVFYFTAPGRIDFRELVKDLVHQYRARIELRQIGVRHETQLIGAVGNCGMVCCCRRYLRRFAPVTIRMAKEQNLFLNPAKISGICGRLLCCLAYEQENYDQFHRECPRTGKRYQTRRGPLKVLRANMFRNSVTVLSEAGEEQEISLDEWRTLESRRPDSPAERGRAPEAASERPKDGADGPDGGDSALPAADGPDGPNGPGGMDDADGMGGMNGPHGPHGPHGSDGAAPAAPARRTPSHAPKAARRGGEGGGSGSSGGGGRPQKRRRRR